MSPIADTLLYPPMSKIIFQKGIRRELYTRLLYINLYRFPKAQHSTKAQHSRCSILGSGKSG
jgi:hypothetical protein